MNNALTEVDRIDEPNPRKPWLAALSSTMLPGLGQVYNGQLNRGLWCFLIFGTFSIPGVTLAAIYLPGRAMLAALLSSLLISVGTWLFSIVDAWRKARRSVEFWCRPWQSAGLYVALFVVCNLVLLPFAINHVRQHQVQAFRIPSESMSPTLLPGDFLFADMRYNCPTCAVEVSRDDVVIFIYPNNRNQYHIKRVLGMPGDTVVVQDDGVSVVIEESLIDEERSAESSDESRLRGTVVPPGHVFVVGDNVDQSLDSRTHGPVPLADIAGKARQLWFSRSEEGVRWARIGQPVE